jgi:PAS domain S-box-containing protein
VNFAGGGPIGLSRPRRQRKMEAHLDYPAEEIKRLQRCNNDLVSVLALPAMWTGAEASQVVSTLLEAILGMLQLDLVYLRLKDRVGNAPLEAVRVAPSKKLMRRPEEICDVLSRWVGDDPQKWPAQARSSIGEQDISIVPFQLGLHGDLGVIVGGSQRADFPRETERLLLSVAANQACIGLQEARALSAQKRVAAELDRQVAQRTAELAKANEGLKRELAERKQTEDKLRRSEALLAEVQLISLTGGFSWRVDTDNVTFSAAAYRIFEFENDAPVTLQQIASRVHPEDLPLLSEEMAGKRADGGDQDYEIRLRMPDGSVKYLHTISHGIRDNEGRLEYIGAMQDITRRRLSEEALSRARSELAQVSRVTTLGVLTASIAHEVNQPLSGIITNASTCLRMLAADPPNVDGARETARRTIRDGNRASEVVARLRALFSKKDATTEALNLNEAVLEVIAVSLTELQENRLTVRHELADDLPLVTGDRVQLQQVILNLLRNASDAMSAVDDRPRQLLIRTDRDEADGVCLSVQDAGIGFDPQVIDRLFNAFYTTKHDGMGIGLSVSRNIIESHHGRLWATLNNDRPGATFSFSIPCGPEHGGGSDGDRKIRSPDLKDAA